MDALVLIFPTLFLSFCTALYLYLTRHFNYWKTRDIEYIRPTPGVGNMGPVFTLRQALTDRIKEFHMNSNSRFTGFFMLDKPALIVRDLDLMKRILVKDFAHFVDRDFSPDETVEPIMAHGLFGLKGDRWRDLRVKITPSFTSGKMKGMFYLVRDCSVRLSALLGQYADTSTPVDVKDAMSRFTTDAISTCALGIEGRAIDDPDWILRKVCLVTANPDVWTSIKSVILTISPWVISRFKIVVLPKFVYETMRKVIWETVKSRENDNGLTRNDFLDSLIEMRKKTIEENIDRRFLVIDGDTLVAQTLTFLIAGFETSSTTMSLALYEMALRPDVQTKAREEIRNVIAQHDGELTYDGLHEMKYLGQIFYETLRKYPVLQFIDRLCTKDYQVPDSDLVIETGTRIFFSMSAIQNDPDNFADPDTFDPDRFSDENANSYHKFSFLPFGEGPRNCIGMRFGIMQSKAGLATVLKDYRVEPCATTPFPPEFSKVSISLSIIGGIPLKIERVP